ncbi:MAG: hypothetical protein AAFQ31_05555 [Planctomycetota bacterium]
MSDSTAIEEIKIATGKLIPSHAAEIFSTVSDADLLELVQAIDTCETKAGALESLGRSLGSGATGKPAIEEARMMLARLGQSIRSAICGSDTVREAVKRPALASTYVIAALVLHALLKAQVAGSLNVYLVAVVAVRGGLEDLCRKEWS